MKKFLFKTTLFLAIIACLDMIFGKAYNYMFGHAKGGMTYRDYYMNNNLKTDILLAGSSRCVHHYNPQIISDSTNQQCYNSGQAGNGIILLYGRLQMLKRQSMPKLIIYDVNPDYDYLLGVDNHQYLTWLKPYYDINEVKDIILSVDPTEIIKMKSNMYRYNSRFLEIFVDFIHPIIESVKDNGFEPTPGEMDKSKIKGTTYKKEEYHLDSLKCQYMESYAEEAGKGLVFCVSPIWYGMDPEKLVYLKDLCRKKNIVLIDYSNHPKYVNNDKFFKDGYHMNARGADEYTRDLIKELRYRNIIK